MERGGAGIRCITWLECTLSVCTKDLRIKPPANRYRCTSIPRRLGKPTGLELDEEATNVIAADQALNVYALTEAGRCIGIGAHAHHLPVGEAGGSLVVVHALDVARLLALLLDLLPAGLPAWLVVAGASLAVETVPVALALGRDILQGLRVRVESEQAADVRAAQRAQAPHGQIQVLLPGQVLAYDELRGLAAQQLVNHLDLDLPCHEILPGVLVAVPLRRGHGHIEAILCLRRRDEGGLVGPLRKPHPRERVRGLAEGSHQEAQKLVGLVLGV